MQETPWLQTAASASPEHSIQQTNICQKWLMLSLQRERRWCLLGGREKGMSWGQWVGILQESSQPASRGQWNIRQRKCGRQRGGEAERRRLEKHQDLGPQWACSKHPTRLSCPMFQAGAPASPGGVCGWINQQSVLGSIQSPVIGIPMSRTP